MSNQSLTPRAMMDHHRSTLQAQVQHFAQALPSTVAKYLTPERLVKITLAALARQPLLMKCTPASILKCVMEAASLGLEPGGPLGHAYMVPFKNNKRGGQYEAQLIVGYRGLIDLGRRSGSIVSITAQNVFERDDFDIDLANGTVTHKPFFKGDRGLLLAVYCIARFKDSGVHVDFMTRSDVDNIRSRSRSGQSGPWVTDYNEMAKKTVVRRAAKYWPLSTELMRAFELDDRHNTGEELGHQIVGEMDLPELPQSQPSTKKIAAKLKAKKKEEPEPKNLEEGEIVEDEDEDHSYGPPPMSDEERRAFEDMDDEESGAFGADEE